MTAGAQREQPPRDPGAQPERTRLAWRRTTLSFAVCVGLLARKALTGGGGWAAALTALAVLAWLGFLYAAHRRIVGLSAARPRMLRGGLATGAVLCTLAVTIVGGMMLR